jgi:hypothetical protein
MSADNEFRHPAPPNYRTSRNGQPRAKIKRVVLSEYSGYGKPNLCVPPTTYTNGVGERLYFNPHSFLLRPHVGVEPSDD